MIEAKRALRAEMRTVRSGLDPALGTRLAGHVLGAWSPAQGAVVAGFWPLPGEIDVRPLLLAWAGQGHRVALPQTPPPGAPLRFRRWTPGTTLVAGRFGTRHPEAEVVQPDVLLVPLLAFDAAGNRLGYGAGYYDRTLEALPAAYTIGCGFASQERAAIPCEKHDRKLDALATERGFRRLQSRFGVPR